MLDAEPRRSHRPITPTGGPRHAARALGLGLIGALALGLGAMAAGTSPALAQDSASVGDVTHTRAFTAARASDQERQLAQADAVYAKELLVTGPDARLEVQMADGATLTLGERATLALDDLVVSEEGTSGHLSLFGGPFLLVAGDRPHRDLSIQTPVAVIGIRGTTVWGGWIDGNFEVMLVEGTVTVSNSAGSVTLDEAGEGTRCEGFDVPPTDPMVWPQVKRDMAYQSVSLD